ncbi:MAG: class I SAM-dependent methyltransferase [Myxococcota bacterium]
MTDFYATNADIYAAITRPSLPGQLAALRAVMTAPFNGPVVELAAGIGTALSTLAALTEQEIFAVEPSIYMRVGLMTTVVSDDALRARVTVLPGTLGDNRDRLPKQLGGIVVLNALGHFEPSALSALWTFAAQRLAPGGQLVVGLQPPFEPVEIPWSDFGESKVGRLTYRTAGTASVDDAGVARWTMRWTTHDTNGAELARREASTEWAVVGPKQVTEAATAVGLKPSGHDLETNMLSFQRPS